MGCWGDITPKTGRLKIRWEKRRDEEKGERSGYSGQGRKTERGGEGRGKLAAKPGTARKATKEERAT